MSAIVRINVSVETADEPIRAIAQAVRHELVVHPADSEDINGFVIAVQACASRLTEEALRVVAGQLADQAEIAKATA